MDSSTNKAYRRQVSLIAGLAVVLIFIFGLLQGNIPLIVSLVGAAIAIIAWLYGSFIALRSGQRDWLLLLGLGFLVSLALIGVSITSASASGEPNAVPLSIAELGLLPLAFITMSYASLSIEPLLARGVVAYLGGWGLLSLIIGGTLVGGAIGTKIGAATENVLALGFHLYIVASVLALAAWLLGIIVGFRTKAWGWFAVVILIPAIGAFMFGLFGPTHQDVVMARENARQRRAVGLG
jgi:hypothetical protein